MPQPPPWTLGKPRLRRGLSACPCPCSVPRAGHHFPPAAQARNWRQPASTISLLAHPVSCHVLAPADPVQSACFSSSAPPPPPPPEARPPGLSGRVQLHPYRPASSSRPTSSRFCWVISDLFKPQISLGGILCPLPAMFPSCLKFLRGCS